MRTSSAIPRSSLQTQRAILLKRGVRGFARHWLLCVNLLVAVWVGLPWLAPVFMHLGWTSLGKVLYLIYSFQCHQLPERSYFLFGKQLTYSLTEIQSAWQTTTNPFILRQFIGNSEMGWKVAWSDRMVSMYTSILFDGLLYGLVRKQQKPLSFWTFTILLLPMIIDGGKSRMVKVQNESGFCCFRTRSEDHPPELQSPDHLVSRLLLEKKN